MLHKKRALGYDLAVMYVPTPAGYLELMGIHSEWNARKHRYTPLGGNWWRLDFLMVDDGPGGRRRNPSIPLSVTFHNGVAVDWRSVRMQLFYWLEGFKKSSLAHC